jgi:DHA1 family tetracycline resistance protein-like MFS transporter
MRKPQHLIDFPQLLPMWVAVYIDILGYSILLPFLPYFMQVFQSTPVQIGFLLATNAIFGLFFGPIWGKLSDLKGRKPILMICQLGSLAGFILLAFSTTLPILYLSRIIDGVFGGIFPIAKAVVSDIVPPKERSKQMTNIGLGHTLASLVGPGIGGILSRWGLIAPGLLAAALTVLAFLLTLFYFKESLPKDLQTLSNPLDPLSPSPETLHVGKHLIETENSQKSKFNDIPNSTWRNSTARYLLIQWAFHTISFSIYMSTVSLFAFIRFSMNAEEVGVLLTIGGLFRVAIRFLLFVPILKILGEKKTSILGLAVFVLVYLMLSFVADEITFLVVLMGVSFAASCARGPLNSFLTRAVKPKDQGKVMGYATSLDNVAQIIGPIIGGFVLEMLDPIWFGMIINIFAIIPLMMAFRPLHFVTEEKKTAPSPQMV